MPTPIKVTFHDWRDPIYGSFSGVKVEADGNSYFSFERGGFRASRVSYKFSSDMPKSLRIRIGKAIFKALDQDGGNRSSSSPWSSAEERSLLLGSNKGEDLAVV